VDEAVPRFRFRLAGSKAGNQPRAVYGADGAGSADVTARIIGLIKSGQKSIVAGNDELGGDPAFGSVKQLRVEIQRLVANPAPRPWMKATRSFSPRAPAKWQRPGRPEKTSVKRTFVNPPPYSSAGNELFHVTASLI